MKLFRKITYLFFDLIFIHGDSSAFSIRDHMFVLGMLSLREENIIGIDNPTGYA